MLRTCWWEWNLNPQYSYGVLVPILSLLLLARRWPDRPEPKTPGQSGKAAAAVVLPLAALVLAALQPMVISNADWRMVPAIAAASGAVFTLAFIFLAGGAPWLRHFAFPVLFFLVAVPWPRPQENAIMSWLMSHNTALCVEALHWLGYAAEQRGNLIAIPGALLGVEEACSGIRSLQSMIMVSLAIGEFFRLAWPRRIVLLLLGVGTALAGNSIRSLTLSVAACRSGASAVDSIHDGTGLAVLAGASAVVLLAGRLMAPKKPPVVTQPGGFALPWIIPHAKFAAITLLALFAAALVGGEGWFRWHESKAAAAPPIWTISSPQPSENTRDVPIAERTLDILLYPDVAKSEQWRDDQGWQWQSFYLHWPPGPTSVQSAFVVHDPRVCLGAAGFELESPLPPWVAEAGGFRIPFQRYLFRDPRGQGTFQFESRRTEANARIVHDEGRLHRGRTRRPMQIKRLPLPPLVV
ncbi:MAG: exosortase/archaeosortase family protein, partial [Chthoniobacterales bacterium]